MSRSVVPDNEDKREMAGRMYEALDIARAIESGQLNTLNEVLTALNQSADSLNKLLKCEIWIVGDNSCVDIPASMSITQQYHEFVSQKEADDSDKENTNTKDNMGMSGLLINKSPDSRILITVDIGHSMSDFLSSKAGLLKSHGENCANIKASELVAIRDSITRKLEAGSEAVSKDDLSRVNHELGELTKVK